jgi:hypothetical protein
MGKPEQVGHLAFRQKAFPILRGDANLRQLYVESIHHPERNHRQDPRRYSKAALIAVIAASEAWQDAGRSVQVAVNVSPVELEKGGFIEFTTQTLRNFGLEGSSLVLEVTASAGSALTEPGKNCLRAARKAASRSGGPPTSNNCNTSPRDEAAA